MKKLLYIPLVLALVAADRLTKYLIVAYRDDLASGKVTGLYIPGFIRTVYYENRGAAFGILENARWFFVVITAVALVFACWIIITSRMKSVFGEISLIIVVGGALGNFIDRAFSGYVVDFLDFTFMNFAVFNFADICITCGGVMLAVYLLFFYDKRNENAPLDPVNPA